MANYLSNVSWYVLASIQKHFPFSQFPLRTAGWAPALIAQGLTLRLSQVSSPVNSHSVESLSWNVNSGLPGS